ncbi:MAG TPA: hypothetical protein VGJ83_01415 [Gemmatimonadales bacterium]|jgi:hypothetical protein
MRSVPAVIWAVLAAATSAVVGVIWDISWHRTIGRDTFWTPAHLAIYASGIIAGLSCGWLVLKTTFAGTEVERGTAVRFWGFYGPLGAWCCIWGALAMIVSAPFDNWWHNAYGLDVKVLSPPHAILALGFTGIELGAVLMVLALQNRAGAGEDARRRYGLLLAYGFGVLVLNKAIMGFEQIGFPNAAHNGLYYQVSALIFPLLLVAGARASTLRWPATTAALVYMGITLIMVWVLPLFPATPQLAPVYRPLTHMVAPPFPIILAVPAIVIDVLMRRFAPGERRDWMLAALVGVGFLAALLLPQWFATPFLISPASENFFFGANRWNYNSLPGDFEHRFWNIRADPLTPLKLGIAVLLAFASARGGLWLGNGLARIKR